MKKIITFLTGKQFALVSFPSGENMYFSFKRIPAIGEVVTLFNKDYVADMVAHSLTPGFTETVLKLKEVTK